MNVHAVIMAGGSGTRFWPASRRDRPKQFLALGGDDRSLLAVTIDRLAPLVPLERVWVVTGAHLVDRVRECVPALAPDHILAEPVGRNTAPCIGWAATKIAREDPSALLAVMPSDHVVTDAPALREAMERALDAARGGDLVTMGIRPTRPETGFGYLEMEEELAPGVHRAKRFVEKPDLARATAFLDAGTYLWNAGMFFFRADAVLERIRADLPELADALDAFDEAAARGEEERAVQERFGALPNVSIDHGVMEKAPRVLVVPVACGWSDVGSWQAAWDLAPRDHHENALPAGAVAIDADGCYVVAPNEKLVAIVGVSDLIVVDTDDALLILPRDRAQDVRAVVDALKARGDDRT
jgi:mannose-1-phosphate guanylyltransferase